MKSIKKSFMEELSTFCNFGFEPNLLKSKLQFYSYSVLFVKFLYTTLKQNSILTHALNSPLFKALIFLNLHESWKVSIRDASGKQWRRGGSEQRLDE